MKTKEILLPEEIITLPLESDDIYLSIKIGNAQIGGSIVTNNKRIITKGVLSELTHIGALKTLENGKITIRTNILDVNAYSNSCVMTCTITNQNNIILYSKIYNENAPGNGILSFISNFTFKVLAIFLIFWFFTVRSLAQTDISQPSVSLFDNTQVSEQLNPQNINISLLGILQSGGSIEFSPYWLISHPDLFAKDVYTTKFPVLYNSSVSLSSLSIDSTRNFALGLRSRLFQFRNKKNLAYIDSLRQKIEEFLIDINLDTSKIELYRESYMRAIINPTFSVDFSFATGSEFEDLHNIEFNRQSFWINTTYRNKFTYFSLLLRYTNDNIKEHKYFFDSGISANYEKNNFYIGFEVAKRFDLDTNLKLVVVSSIKLNKFMYLSCAVGKNFDNTLIVVGGINAGITFEKLKI